MNLGIWRRIPFKNKTNPLLLQQVWWSIWELLCSLLLTTKNTSITYKTFLSLQQWRTMYNLLKAGSMLIQHCFVLVFFLFFFLHRVAVYTHCRHTFIFKHHVKVNFPVGWNSLQFTWVLVLSKYTITFDRVI